MPIPQENAGSPTQDEHSISEFNGGTDTSDTPSSVQSTMMTPFGCVICSHSFSQVKDLHVHMNSAHRNAFRCNFCMAEFQQPHLLERHFYAHLEDGLNTD